MTAFYGNARREICGGASWPRTLCIQVVQRRHRSPCEQSSHLPQREEASDPVSHPQDEEPEGVEEPALQRRGALEILERDGPSAREEALEPALGGAGQLRVVHLDERLEVHEREL